MILREQIPFEHHFILQFYQLKCWYDIDNKKKKLIKSLNQSFKYSNKLMEHQLKQRTQHLQLIDDNRILNKQAVQNIASALNNVDRKYYTIAIIGVQNSGKSTLLNKLFGTKFEVLKGQTGIRTTRGIWTSLDKQQSFIIMDVQGNDAMDRAQQQDYQKMVSTYSLVMANVLLINIWSKSLGGYRGSQYQTLNTILEICLQNFKLDCPKTILFCVRDFNQQFDEQGELRRKLVRDVNGIWQKIQKTEEMKKYQTTPERFFTVEVCVLRKFDQDKPQRFQQDIGKLRKRFVDEKNENYIFKKQKTDFNLPIKDLPDLAANSWKTITENKKLNLPGQKEQLAKFRCSQIASTIQQQLMHQFNNLQNKHIDYGQFLEKSMEKFKNMTYYYGKNIIEQKKTQLKDHLHEEIVKIILQELQKYQQKISNQFSEACIKLRQNQEKDYSVSLPDKAQILINQQIQKYIQLMKIFNYEIPQRKELIERLHSKLLKDFKDLRKKTFQMIKNQFQNSYSRQIRLLASSLLLEQFGEEFWQVSIIKYNDKKTQMISQYSAKYRWISDTALDPMQIDKIEQRMQNQFKSQVKKDLEKSLSNRVYDCFIDKMYKNEKGQQISFQLMQQAQIEQRFNETRDSISMLISRINQFKTKSDRRSSIIIDQEQESNMLFESTWISNTSEQIDKRMITEFQKILRRKKQSEMKKVPWWLFLIMIFFVYDDIWFTQAESPIVHYTLTLLVCLIITAFALGRGEIIYDLVHWIGQKIPFSK